MTEKLISNTELWKVHLFRLSIFPIRHLYGTVPEYPLESQRVSGKYHLTENLLKGWVTLYD